MAKPPSPYKAQDKGGEILQRGIFQLPKIWSPPPLRNESGGDQPSHRKGEWQRKKASPERHLNET